MTKTTTTSSFLAGIAVQVSLPQNLDNLVANSNNEAAGYSTVVIDASGIQGFMGFQGNQGAYGIDGSQGSKGIQGNFGRQGPVGAQGNQGLQGNQGYRGLQGIINVRGSQGIQGYANSAIGYQGFQGSTQIPLLGTQGSQGRQGLQGLQGSGFQGYQGLGPVRDGVTGSAGSDGFYGYQSSIMRDPWFVTYQILGSAIKSISLSVRLLSQITSSYTMSVNTLLLSAVIVPQQCLATGVMWFQHTQGVYTGSDNYNGVGLYSQNNGALTLIASSTNDFTIWKASSSTVNKKAFTSAITINAGVYYIGALYSYSSSASSDPRIGAAATLINANVQLFNLSNSNKLMSTLSSQTSMPSSLSMSSTTAISSTPHLALY